MTLYRLWDIIIVATATVAALKIPLQLMLAHSLRKRGRVSTFNRLKLVRDIRDGEQGVNHIIVVPKEKRKFDNDRSN